MRRITQEMQLVASLNSFAAFIDQDRQHAEDNIRVAKYLKR